MSQWNVIAIGLQVRRPVQPKTIGNAGLSHLLLGELVGRHPIKLGQFTNGTDVSFLRPRAATDQLEIFGHLLAQFGGMKLEIDWRDMIGSLLKGNRNINQSGCR